MYLISNRDLELVIRALEVMEYRNGEPWRIRETKFYRKVSTMYAEKTYICTDYFLLIRLTSGDMMPVGVTRGRPFLFGPVTSSSPVFLCRI